MQKVVQCMRGMNRLSLFILHSGIRISFLMFAISLVFTYAARQFSIFHLDIISCAQAYPLLTIMVLSLSIVGAFLIDIYAKKYK